MIYQTISGNIVRQSTIGVIENLTEKPIILVVVMEPVLQESRTASPSFAITVTVRDDRDGEVKLRSFFLGCHDQQNLFLNGVHCDKCEIY